MPSTRPRQCTRDQQGPHDPHEKHCSSRLRGFSVPASGESSRMVPRATSVIRLSKLFEFLFRDPKLFENAIEEWRTDLVTAMNRNGCSTAIRVNPSFMTAGLSRFSKSEFSGGPLEFARTGARHERSRWYRRGGAGSSPGTPPKST